MIHTTENAALDEIHRKEKFIGFLCPFHARMSQRTLCGNWCPHFSIVNEKVFITCSGSKVEIS